MNINYAMCYMQTEAIKIDKHFLKNLGLYFADGLGSDGSIVKVIVLIWPVVKGIWNFRYLFRPISV